MCTPALRALRSRYKDSHIAFLTEKESSDLLSLNPYLNEVVVLDREKYRNPLYSIKKIWEVRKGAFGLVIDFFGNPRSAYFSRLSGAKHRVGYDHPLRRCFYNMVIKDDQIPKYAAQSRLDALKILGIENREVKLDFFIPNEARLFAKKFFEETKIDPKNLLISISPTSRRHFNRWALERYAQLADWLISQFDANIILVWGPGEKEVVEKVKYFMRKDPIISGETRNLFELGAILERCDLHIGNDNGTKHIAVAMSKPTITIYGPHNPISWTYPDFSRHKFVKKEVDCPDCERIKHKCTKLSCLDLVTVEDVQKTFVQLLNELKDSSEGFILKEKMRLEKLEHIAVDQR
jgi:ADP-heptose:LPS heptosyltransferase